MESTQMHYSAHSIWDSLRPSAVVDVLKGFRVSPTVAKQVQYRSYVALPRWIKVKLKRHARELRAIAKRERTETQGGVRFVV